MSVMCNNCSNQLPPLRYYAWTVWRVVTWEGVISRLDFMCTTEFTAAVQQWGWFSRSHYAGRRIYRTMVRRVLMEVALVGRIRLRGRWTTWIIQFNSTSRRYWCDRTVFTLFSFWRPEKMQRGWVSLKKKESLNRAKRIVCNSRSI